MPGQADNQPDGFLGRSIVAGGMDFAHKTLRAYSDDARAFAAHLMPSLWSARQNRVQGYLVTFRKLLILNSFA
jgi:hypothetical protein